MSDTSTSGRPESSVSAPESAEGSTVARLGQAKLKAEIEGCGSGWECLRCVHEGLVGNELWKRANNIGSERDDFHRMRPLSTAFGDDPKGHARYAIAYRVGESR